MITRRRALAGFLAAPAIVRIASIMPVRTPPLVLDPTVVARWRDFNVWMESVNEINAMWRQLVLAR